MEMRGAGNLLGGDQSGFAQAVGVDTYMRLLEKTVSRLKGGAQERVWPDPEITMVGSAYLPDEYISDSGQKLHLYRRLSKLVLLSEVDSLREELADRFGEPPQNVEHLLQATSLRILGRKIGVERILVRENEARINFLPAVVPRLSVLEGPLQDRDVDVEVRRMAPLSVVLRQREPNELISTLISALTALLDTQSARV
jgi:transcription-repair coupling factor (superfamily II helicase)